MIKIAEKNDLHNGTVKVMSVKGIDIALFRIDDKFFALDNECPHAGGPLSEGEIEGGCIRCPWHGYQYDLRTGACITEPVLRARTRELVIRGEEIFIDA